MHILLTDVLACPRCGPEFGLIVLADRMAERRVVEGRLGCANCREEYPIRAGVADLRLKESAPPERRSPRGSTEEIAFRTAALLGVAQGTGIVLLLEAAPDLVASVAALLPNAQVVGGSAAPLGDGSPGAGPHAGWIVHGPVLPFRDRSLKGVALLGEATHAEIGEAARVLAVGARLLLDPAAPEVREVVEREGLTVLLEQDDVVVASAPDHG